MLFKIGIYYEYYDIWYYSIMIAHHLYQGFLQARLGGGRLPPKNQLLPPNIFTDFIFIHPEPPTPRLLPPKSFNSPPKGEILQETLYTITDLHLYYDRPPFILLQVSIYNITDQHMYYYRSAFLL